MRLHVETCGAGEDLVLLHGWGMHGGVWDGVKKELAASFQLHIVDLPGHGKSPSVSPYSLGRLVDELAAALPQRAHWCGWSLGGLAVLEAARRFPQRMARLVLVASTPCFAQRHDWPCAMAPETLDEFAAALEGDYEGTLKRFLSLQVRGDAAAKAVLRSLREGLFARGHPAVEALRGGLEILLGSDLRDQVTALAQPALVIHGDRDMLAPLPAAEWLAQRLPAARLDIFPGAAHAPFLSHPQEFTRAIAGFLHE
jgi:pimeloyl-[acyl-carrier protein] methyl ester esterase